MARALLLTLVVALAAPASAASYHVWQVSPQQIVLPQSPPGQVGVLERLEGRPLRITACRGEFEPWTFVVYTEDGLHNVRLRWSDLAGEIGRIPASAIDGRAVVCWWQDAGVDAIAGERFIVPELLVKNASLISRDDARRDNTLHFEGLPEDANLLQPVDIPPGCLQQFWLTVHVPNDARPGAYTGTVTITADGADSTRVEVVVTVPDFDLLAAAKDYSMYYRGRLDPVAAGKNPLALTEERYRAEMRDLVAHGCTQPSIWEGEYGAASEPDWAQLKRALAIRREEGALAGPVPFMDHGMAITSARFADARPAEIRAQTRKILDFFKQNGYPEPLFYGADEAYGEMLVKGRAAYGAVNDAGGRVAAACRRGYFSDMGERLNVPIVVSPSLRGVGDAVRATQACGGRAWFYYPQTSLEDPRVWRQLAGFWLWTAGLDGVAPFAYQSAPGNPYVDWDPEGSQWRDHNFAYPTRTGVLDTLHWEAFREGADDVRYCTTLWAHLRLARELRLAAPVLDETQAWFDGIRLDYPARPESVIFTAPTDLLRHQEQSRVWQVRDRLVEETAFDYLADLRARVIERIEALRAEFPALRTAAARARLRELAEEAKAQHLAPPPTDAEIAVTYANLYGLSERYKEQGDWLHAFRIGERLLAFAQALDPARWTRLREEAETAFGLYRYEFLKSPQFAQAYEEVLSPPTGWLFRTDPNQAGVVERWFAGDVRGEWKPISVDQRWEDQGYPGYDGDGWYRVTFVAPESLRGRQVLACLGRLNDMGWVYLNGQKIYDHTVGPERAGTPILVDLTPRLRLGRKNLLAVRVRDQAASGGLYDGVKIVSPRPQ